MHVYSNSKFERRKPRAEHDKPGQRPGWKGKDSTGVGKRLRQAAEAASADAQNAHSAQTARSSVQDRLKRYTARKTKSFVRLLIQYINASLRFVWTQNLGAMFRMD